MKYKALIGLEMHCELKSNSKVFSSSKNDFSENANEFVSSVDVAFPGVLPVVNKECVRSALMMSIALNCKQPEYMYFERKNYYYPDLPKGYQITQETKPIPVGIYGTFSFMHDDEVKKIRINNIHLEEDSASLDHFDNKTLINYNRAGVPLLELVTEPDIKSASEAVSFLESVKSVYQYANISDAESKKGQIRCDVNISIMDESLDEKDSNNWGTRIEIKNVNTFSGVKDAINYEIKRQIELKENGTYNKMEQSTRRWDEESGTTKFMRDKANAIDYKYFVDPNIPKFKIDKSWIDEIKQSIPVLPFERFIKYRDIYNLNTKDIRIILRERNYADYFEECISLGLNPIVAMNWLTGNIISYLNKNDICIKDFFITPKYLSEIITEYDNGNISSKQAKEIFIKSLENKQEPKSYFEDNVQLSNKDELQDIIMNILNNNKDNVVSYKNGKTNLFDFFVGQAMKETKGRANPNIVKEILIKKLNDN